LPFGLGLPLPRPPGVYEQASNLFPTLTQSAFAELDVHNKFCKMPVPVENGASIPRLNQQGAICLLLMTSTQASLKFIGETKRTILEVAAGYSHIVIKALEADAKRVFANDIVAHQLQIINILSAAAVRESAHLFARKIS
jgi:hypothetical protein